MWILKQLFLHCDSNNAAAAEHRDCHQNCENKANGGQIGGEAGISVEADELEIKLFGLSM